MISQGVKVSFTRTIGSKKCYFEGIIVEVTGKRTLRITNVTSKDCFTDKSGVYIQDVSQVTVLTDLVTKEMKEFIKSNMDSMFKFYKNHPELIHNMGYRISKINNY